MKKYSSLMSILTLLLIILVSFSASCDKRNPPPILAPVPLPPSASQERYITRMTANPDRIYADYNITYSIVSAEIKDGEGFGVPNQMVKFKTNLGRIISDVPTDSSGVAKTTFYDDGDIGIATISAIVRNYDASGDTLIWQDSTAITVEIKEIPPVENVELKLKDLAPPYTMSIMQVITVTAITTNAEGQEVPNNTLVTFSCNERGYFVDSGGNEIGTSAVVGTYNGRATVKYNSGTRATTMPGEEPAMITATVGGVSDTKEITVEPGNPANIRLKTYVRVDNELVETDTSSVNSPNWIFVQAKLTDIYHNACPYQPVKFSTDIGSFLNTTQTVTQNTQLDGIASVRFTPGLSAGAASIQATANNDTLRAVTIFMINSSELYSLDFTQSSQLNLNVANTGGLESAILRVKLRDINGNLIDAPQKVYFRIANINAPAGANINGYPQQDSVEVISNGGEAQVSVNSGTESGIVKIKVSWVSENGNRYIYALKTNIVIHSGPPVPGGIISFVSGFDSGQELGGGLWRVQCGAIVKDIYNNPVDWGTTVWFSIVDNANCEIEASARVGNQNAEGDSTAGVAYTYVTYDGTLTYHTITIRANCGDDPYGVPIFGDTPCILPLNGPEAYIEAQPLVLMFDLNQTNYEFSDIYFYLTDAQGCQISNAKVMFLALDGGHFIYSSNAIYDPASLPNEYWRLLTNQNGYAIARIAFSPVEAPPPVEEIPQPVPMRVRATLVEALLNRETVVTLIKFPGTAPW